MNAIDWAAVIGRAGEYYRMRTPPSAERIEAVQAALDTRFPQELIDLYLQTDGIYDSRAYFDPVWPLDEVLSENLRAFVDDPPPRDQYLGFGDDGTGNPYCVRRDGGEAVYYFGNILSEVTFLTDGLRALWEQEGPLPPH